MTMYVLIEHKPEGKYTASLIGWPGLIAQGNTEDEAISYLRRSLSARIGDAKIVSLDMGATPSWLQTAGIFRDDPFADELDAAIADYRRERDATDLPTMPHDHAA